MNNGKPLPEGIDKERYGMNGVKSKSSSGFGTGGFVVKSITEHYGGDYDIFSRDSAGDYLIRSLIYNMLDVLYWCRTLPNPEYKEVTLQKVKDTRSSWKSKRGRNSQS